MKLLDLLHRWTGGLIGLLLALMGLSGAILLHKDAWIMLPHAGDAQIHDMATVAGVVARLTADPAARPTSFLFADETFGLHRVNYAGGAGAYADQSGEIVTRWAGIWDRPELWLFDFHHYLFSGETGAAVAGTLGLIGLGFVVTGAILWWPRR